VCNFKKKNKGEEKKINNKCDTNGHFANHPQNI